MTEHNNHYRGNGAWYTVPPRPIEITDVQRKAIFLAAASVHSSYRERFLAAIVDSLTNLSSISDNDLARIIDDTLSRMMMVEVV